MLPPGMAQRGHRHPRGKPSYAATGYNIELRRANQFWWIAGLPRNRFTEADRQTAEARRSLPAGTVDVHLGLS